MNNIGSSVFRALVILLVVLFPCRSLWAQTIKGTLYDGKTGEPIPYASIGIKNKSRGGIAERTGYYSVNIAGMSPQDSIVFSHIGYVTMAFRLADIDPSKKMDIRLKPRDQVLAGVTVTALRDVLMFGSDKATSRFTGWGDYSSSRGRARGIQITPKEYPVKIVSFACRIKHNTFDSVKVRFNILKKVEGEEQLKEVLHQNIYFDIPHNAKWVTLDLAPYNIILSDTVVIALEWVDSWAQPKKPGESSDMFTIALSKEHGYTYERNTPNELPTLRQSMELPAMYLKGYRVATADK
ncbi:carboxypeptidase-like regulatory domain-containing protein [Chitinophaga pendula]|uniref:carboxypeptidase-like regulatory domain-containing protein n=1 Tax=Chitinophaga TaxID=79328 RepID=UPI000BB09A68|nr:MULTISPECIES: carboxypeptidase-like regulatory domain-containing protein [Chitinophaga]ASZ11969.1 hypothetical protein CK934_13865 [Chitinophaga sp. MD30]UCJ05002.1 carboxypeptidase-like regulatory domain-containing protein [Chitinophaga pendula]